MGWHASLTWAPCLASSGEMLSSFGARAAPGNLLPALLQNVTSSFCTRRGAIVGDLASEGEGVEKLSPLVSSRPRVLARGRMRRRDRHVDPVAAPPV